MSNFKYGASCTDVMYTKLEHPTNNLKDTRLFAGKLKIGKLKIFINAKNNFIGWFGLALGFVANADSPASVYNCIVGSDSKFQPSAFLY